MQEISDKIIINLLNKNKNCNFVAHAITPWHANGIEASIEFLKEKGVNLNGYIFMCQHPNTGKCISEKNFYLAHESCNFLEVCFENKNWIDKVKDFWSALNYILKKHNALTDNFYIFNTTYPDFNWINIIKKIDAKKKPVFVVIDEGSGSYLFQSVGAWVSMHLNTDDRGFKREVKRKLLYFLGIARIIPRAILTDYFSRNGDYYDNRLLILDKKRKLTVNRELANEYVKVFDKYRMSSYSQICRIYANKILLNTQCLQEDGYIDCNQDLNVYDIFFRVSSNVDLKVVLKNHPRERHLERYSKYDCLTDTRSGLPQEILVNNDDKPCGVVGIYTSSLITLKTLYNIPSISLAKFLLKEDISQDLRTLLLTFINTYDGLVLFPENEQEFTRILINLKLAKYIQ